MSELVAISTWRDAVLSAGREVGLGHLTGLVLGTLREELEVLDDDPDLVEAARSSIAANIALVVDVVSGRLTLDDVEPPPQAIAFARELARRNVPIVALDQAYRVATLALWRWTAAEVQARVEGDASRAIGGLSEAIFVTSNVFSATVLEHYAAERERWLRSTDAVRATTLQEILSGSAVDVAACSARLGYELRQEHQAFVVWSADDSAETLAAAVTGGRGLLRPCSAGAVAGWCPVGALDARPVVGANGWLAVGAPGWGVDGFRRSHAEAREARRVARMTERPPGRIDYDDVAVVALLTHDLEQARRFAERTLGPLADPDPAMRRLAQTLRVTLEHQGSPRRAAQALGLHENTIAKRLRAVEELLGDDVRRRPARLAAALEILDATGWDRASATAA